MPTPTTLYRDLLSAASFYNEQLTKKYYGIQSPTPAPKEKSLNDTVSETSSYYEVAINHIIHKDGPVYPEPAYFQTELANSSKSRAVRSYSTGSFQESIRAIQMRTNYDYYVDYPNELTYNRRVLYDLVAHVASVHGLVYAIFIAGWAATMSTIVTYPIFFTTELGERTATAKAYLYGFNWLFMPLAIILMSLLVVAARSQVRRVAIKLSFRWAERVKLASVKKRDLEKGITAEDRHDYAKYKKHANVNLVELKPLSYTQPAAVTYGHAHQLIFSDKRTPNWKKIVIHATFFILSQCPLIFGVWLLRSGNINPIWTYHILVQVITIAVAVPIMLWAIDIKLPHQ